MHLKWIAYFFLFLSTATFATHPPHSYILDNGLKLIVKEDHRAPTVVTMVWYNIGSADEPGGLTGVSHLLEHLMFQGTPRYPQGIFAKKVAAQGGEENAFTTHDYTAYFEKLAAVDLPLSFELEADRMQNLSFNKETFNKEIKVVQEERRLRTDDNPQALAFEQFLATAHIASPYHHPVVGWMSDLQQMGTEDARTWYQQFYTPNNATVVVVGDVSPSETLALAKQYFGALQPHAFPFRRQQAEPPSFGKKTIDIKVEAQVPMLLLGYTVPTVKTVTPTEAAVPYALEILSTILSGGESSRLNQNLIRKQALASDVEVYYNLYDRYQTQFIIFGTPSNIGRLKSLKQAIEQELDRLKKEPISTTELDRVKTQIIAQKTFEQDSIFTQAMELGMLETLGLGWQTAEEYTHRIQQVTPQQLQSVAQTYFSAPKLTEARLIPQRKPL